MNKSLRDSEQLGHLKLVAATILELGIIDKVDTRLDLNQCAEGLVSYECRLAATVKNAYQRIITNFGKHALEIYDLPPDLERVEINYSNDKIFYIGVKGWL